MFRQKISKKMIMIIVLIDIKLIVLVSFDFIVRLFCNLFISGHQGGKDAGMRKEDV